MCLQLWDRTQLKCVTDTVVVFDGYIPVLFLQFFDTLTRNSVIFSSRLVQFDKPTTKPSATIYNYTKQLNYLHPNKKKNS